MIILDTNVVSELSKPTGSQHVLDWVDGLPEGTSFLTSVTLAEMLAGLAALPDGKRKETLRLRVEQTVRRIGTGILAFDAEAARRYAELTVKAKAVNYTLPIADGYIAAIASAHGYTVATRDVDPFLAVGVPVINPWDASAI